MAIKMKQIPNSRERCVKRAEATNRQNLFWFDDFPRLSCLVAQLSLFGKWAYFEAWAVLHYMSLISSRVTTCPPLSLSIK